MATSGSKKINVVSSGNIYLLFSWSIGTANIANNYSPLSWNLKLVSAGNGANIQSTASKKYSVTVDGQTWSDTDTVGISAGASKTLASGTKNIYHNADGTKTFSYSFSQEFNITYSGSKINTISSSGTGILDRIPRAATLTAAPNFNDEENPTITYNNPAGSAVTSLKACIANASGSVIYADYRDISKTGTSYTFNLTNEEREALRWATINSNTLAVKFYVTTVLGGVTYYSTLDKVLTIVNAKPTLAPTVKDTGGYSVPLTGDADNLIIKGFNYMNVSTGAKTYKGASIKSQSITCGSAIINSSSGGFDNVESGTFVFSVTDSRGNTTTQTINKTLIDYIKLTCNLKTNNPTTDGKIDFVISGNYFDGSFGATNNTLQVQFRYKENDGEYSDWITTTPTINNNTYQVEAKLTNLDYRLAYTFQARAIDKTRTIETAEKRVKATPVFDWGENDFQFNVPAYDEKGGKLGTETIANDYEAMALSGKSLLESGWVTITPVANTPTAVYVTFKKHYKKIPVVIPGVSSGVVGTQVSAPGTNGITQDGVNLVITRTNTIPTSIYYYVFGEVE